MASEELERLHRTYFARGLSRAERNAAWFALDDFANALTAKLPFQWQALEANNIAHGFMDCRRHIFLKEDIQFGRLKRKKGTFLCASDAKYYNRADNLAINCKTCLERAERIVAALATKG